MTSRYLRSKGKVNRLDQRSDVDYVPVCYLQSIPLIKRCKDTWWDERDEPAGFDYTFDLGDTDITWWRDFGTFLSEHSWNATRVTLVLNAVDFSMRNLDGDLIPPPCLPVDIPDESFHFINTLEFMNYYDAGSTLQFLSAPRRTEAGLPRWSCPKLNICHFHELREVKSRAGEILRFVEARVQARLNPEGEVPDALETVKVPSGMAEMFSWVEGLHSVTFED